MTEGIMDTAIAVTGMAGRFPGAPSVRDYWRNLCAGVDAIQHFGRDELLLSGFGAELLDHPSFVPACAPVPDPYAFDADYFGMSPATALSLDPQHRAFLECAWTALETAGALASDRSAIAVFAGCSDSPYSVLSNGDGQGHTLTADIGTSSDYLATRVAFLLGLQGPAVTVRTACSTSLVAIHLAVQSLLTEESDTAVAGGAAIRHPLRRGHLYEPGGIYSRDGRCRPYDRLGSGIVSGDGVGAVVLRRLGDALRDGDHVHAVIRGSAINNDGAAKASFAAPSVDGQVRVALTALEMADVEPVTVGFVEGHGTATPLGDPIEVEALSRVWGTPRRKTPCVLGSVKSGIGHLDAASGVASFIKACLAVEHGRIPATLNFTMPNPESCLADSAFVVSPETRDWHEDGPRRASVHSLGLGGTNAHVVLEQGPQSTATAPHSTPVVLTLSTRRPDMMDPFATALAEELAASGSDLAVAARTLHDGRSCEPYRRTVVGRDRAQLVESLRSPEVPARATTDPPRLVLAFPGDGRRDHEAMQELGRSLPPVAAVLRDASEHLRSRWDVNPFRATPGSPPGVLGAIVAQGLAMHAALETFGVGGDVVLGLSLGEITAAAAAGLISTRDALDLAMNREMAFRAVEPSGALAVGLKSEDLIGRLPPRVGVAVVSSPHRCVVSGPSDDLARFANQLAADGIPVSTLDVISAVHSPLLDPVLDQFRQAAARLEPRRPIRQLVSTVGAQPLDELVAADPDHWVRQLREPIRFDRSLSAAFSDSADAVVVDVGPTGGLGAAIQESVGDRVSAVVSASRRTQDVPELEAFGLALGQLWAAGVPVRWDSWPQRATHRTVLPVPPLARTVHSPSEPTRAHTAKGPQPQQPRVALWSRSWRRCVDLPATGAPQRISVLVGGDPVGKLIAQALAGRGHQVDLSASPMDHASGAKLTIDARALGAVEGPTATAAFLALAAQQLARPDHESGRLIVLTRGAMDIVGTESLSVAASAVAAAALVASQETSDARIGCRDLDDGSVEIDLLERTLLHGDALLGLRGRSVWRPTVEQVDHVPPREPAETPVAVITGGLGRFGRRIGRWLAERGCPELFLVSRTGLDAATADRNQRIEAVAAMRAAGARVTVALADLTDSTETMRVLDQAHLGGAGRMTIFHLAGEPHAVSAGAPLDDLARRDVRSALDEQWAAKVGGAETLLRWTRQHPETVCVTFSSNAALLGGPGLAAYAAANAALDSLAIQAREREQLQWCSIGWDGWRLPDDPTRFSPSALEEFALRGDEPWRALERAIGSGHGHISVAKGDLSARHRIWVEEPADGNWSAVGPAIATTSRNAIDDEVATVRQIWADVLGRPASHDDADLFKEGGDSLIAMRIRNRLHRDLNAQISLRDVLANRTITGLSMLVRTYRPDASPGRSEPALPTETVRGRI